MLFQKIKVIKSMLDIFLATDQILVRFYGFILNLHQKRKHKKSWIYLNCTIQHLGS